MITLENVIKKYGNKEVLNIPYFKFEQGKNYLLIGSNGSGKSTLIKCILGINTLTEGKIKICEKNIGYIPEKVFSADFMKVNEFFKNICSLYNCLFDDKIIANYCLMFNIPRYIKLTNMSKGMLQKVMIIQALIHNSNLYIFDEPLNGLDKASQISFLEIVNELKKSNKSIIICTHYPQFYDINFDYKITIEKGNIVYVND